jgi:integrase/recombinase XerD
MRFRQVADAYVRYRTSLGLVNGVEARNLRIFSSACRGCDISEVSPDLIQKFLSRQTPFMRWRHHENLKLFYRYAIARGYVARSPLPDESPVMPPHMKPYIYSRPELKALFAEAIQIRTRRNDPLLGITFQTFLILLYGAAHRRGETLSLLGGDVDLSDNLLIVRGTKFGKTRMVPINPQLTKVLVAYIAERSRLGRPLTPDTHFFATVKQPFLTAEFVSGRFQEIRARLGIRRDDGGRFQPRIHDLRHSFVAHRIEAEYAANRKDVQRLLDELPTYLGHANLISSQPYLLGLTATTLSAANRRFARYALTEVNHD